MESFDENPFMTRTLNIGEIIILKNKEEVIWTVLGSCISVIFYFPQKISMICHAQMPSKSGFSKICADSCPHPCFNLLPDSHDFKFVNCSLEYMLKSLKQNHIQPNKIHATLLGGATVLEGYEHEGSIGYQNILTAKEILDRNHIRIHRELVGGSNGLTLWYYAKTNRLIIKRHKGTSTIELKDNNKT